MKKYWLLSILPVLILLWWGLDHRGSVPRVHFVAAQRARIESTVSTNGKVEPAEWAAARAETSGVVRSILVRRGDNVNAGQILATLDTTAAQSDLATAQAREQEAQAQIAILKQGGRAATVADLNDKLKTAQATLEAAQRNYDSLQRLAAQQAATRLQVQQAKDTLENTKLQVAALQNQQRALVTTNDEKVAQARLSDAKASVLLAQHKISLGEIRAPASGTVYQLGSTAHGEGSADLKIGTYLQPGDLVALIGNLGQVRVTVYVDEPDLGRVAENLPVEITWDAKPGRKWSGRVDKMPTQVIALGTRTVGEVVTVVDNPNHDLLPGVTVYSTIVSKEVKDALSIPKAALRTIGGANGVYKLSGDTLVWTPVHTGISDVNNVQILSGLQQGDQVADRVVEPSDAEIRNGMRVRAVTE